MKDTKIRWATDSWNPMSGCTRISPGCDRCYAFTIAEKFRGGAAYPVGFDPMWRGEKTFRVPRKRREPRRFFVNSMSDLHHEAFGNELLDRVYDEMADLPRHQFLVLTKRPKRMHRYLCGAPGHSRLALGLAGRPSQMGWLERRGLDAVPGHIWLGVSIESMTYAWRADWLRRIPVPIRFLSCEPLLGPVDELDLAGISWVIEGGESGSGYRAMDWDWARALRDMCVDEGVAFFHKQGSAFKSEQFQELDGERWEESPLWHPDTGEVELDGSSPRLRELADA